MRVHEKPAVVPAEVVMQLRRATGLGVLHAKELLTEASPLLYSRLTEAAQTQPREDPRGPNYRGLYDPIEDDSELKKVIQKVEQETEEALRDRKRGMGFCHLFWNTKQRILKEKHGIEWFTPVQMNPGSIYD